MLLPLFFLLGIGERVVGYLVVPLFLLKILERYGIWKWPQYICKAITLRFGYTETIFGHWEMFTIALCRTF